MAVNALRATLLCLAISWLLSSNLLALQTPSPSADRAQVRSTWLTSLELDEPAAVVRDARERMAATQEWAKDGQALALYARALSATGGSQQAFEMLSKAEVSESERVYVELGLARLELEEDRLESLVQRLAANTAEAQVRYPQHADSWWLLGKAYSRMGRPDAAAPHLQNFVKTWRMHPQAPSAWHVLSQLAIARRDMAAAAKYRDQGQNLATWHGYYKTRRMQVRDKPDDALPHFGLAQLWSSVQEFGRATEALDKSLELDPEFARGWALRGELDRQQNRPGSARKAYTRALELDPSLGDARYNRALLAVQAGMEELALSDLTAIVEGPESTAPRYLGAHLALARLHQKLKQVEKAQARFKRYRQLGGTEEL